MATTDTDERPQWLTDEVVEDFGVWAGTLVDDGDTRAVAEMAEEYLEEATWQGELDDEAEGTPANVAALVAAWERAQTPPAPMSIPCGEGDHAHCAGIVFRMQEGWRRCTCICHA